MDNSVIISLVFGVSSIISSFFYGYIPAKQKEKIEKQNKKILKLYKDLNLFNEIEEMLLKELEESTTENKNTAKRRIRRIVTDKKGYTFSDLRNPSNVTSEIDRYSAL